MDPPSEADLKAQEKKKNQDPKPDPDDTPSKVAPAMPSNPPPPPPPPPVAAEPPEEKITEVPSKQETPASNAAPAPSPATPVTTPLTTPVTTPARATTTATTSTTTNGGPKTPHSISAYNNTTSNEEIQSSEERNKDFMDLRAYEAKRRSIYATKMASTQVFWQAFRDMLSKSYQETDRAENLVRGSIVANETYAEFLRAAAEDRLDNQGKPVTEARGKRLQEDRQKKYTTLSGTSIMLGTHIQREKEEMEKKKKATQEAVAAAAVGPPQAAVDALAATVSFDNLPEDSIVNEYVKSQASMAELFTTNVNFVKDVALPKMVDLKKELEAEVNVMSALGDATMLELEKAENDVHKTWAAYYSLANLVAAHKDAPRTQKINVKGVDPNAVTDVWLLEMHYRMAVAYLTTVWEKSSKELSTLFAGMKEMECNRSFRLRELLVLFMQKSETLFGGIPPLLAPVMEELEGKPSEIKALEKLVSENIREKAKTIQKQDDQYTNPNAHTGPGLAGLPDPASDFELQSPLMSKLLSRAEVIWKKSEKMLSVWKPCLAVTTSDSYLHLFEMPATSTIQTGDKPEDAFQTLVPPVEVPTEDGIIEGFLPSTKSWFDGLVPSASLDLKNSNISFDQKKGNSTFEVTETLAPTGLSKLSKNVRKRKYALRLYSSQQMVEWLLVLRELGAE